jgi:hypothetical protein
MSAPSLLSKFKPSTYFLEIKSEWIEFSYNSPEFDLLDKLVIQNKEGLIGLSLLKRNGIHPSEDEAIKEVHEKYLDCAKEYFNTIKLISEETGLTPSEVTTRTSPQLLEEIEALERESDKAKLAQSKKDLKQENLAIAERLAPYNEQYNQVQANYNTSFDNYYVALISLFLSGKRTESAVDFTSENVRNLHSGLRSALANFITNEINGWSSSEGKLS